MFKGHEGTVYSIDLSPDGRFLVSALLTARFVSRSSRKLLDADMSAAFSIASSPDGRYVAAGYSDGMLRMGLPQSTIVGEVERYGICTISVVCGIHARWKRVAD
jgi:WD40 repeat protein